MMMTTPQHNAVCTINRRSFLAILACLPTLALAETSCCGPMTAEGERLRKFLDHTNVENLWLPGFQINWQTGESGKAWPAGSGAHTHCSAFVASAAMRVGVYLLRPPEHRQNLLANAQMGWLASPKGTDSGWQAVADVVAAQTQANQGMLVVAAFENPDPNKPGHIAIVRPDLISGAKLEKSGPMMTQAGLHNALEVSLAKGFSSHPGAWKPGGTGGVRFFAHSVDWKQVK